MLEHWRIDRNSRLPCPSQHRVGQQFGGKSDRAQITDPVEQGVAHDPADLKEVVYTMRYDEASALYAEFGPFYTGLVAPIDDALRELGLRL